MRTNTPNPGTGILFGSVGRDGMLSIASEGRRGGMEREEWVTIRLLGC